MKSKEIRDLSDADLRAHATTVRKDLFGLRFQNATGELENTAGMRAAKRDLARALTIAKQRRIDIDIKHGSEN